MYDANALNQYTTISENGAAAFVPQFDADGNQILTQTETGIWSAVYNAENQPVSFTNSESNTVIEYQYDSMARRSFKKVTVNGTVTLHQRYLYRGYLQIACIDLTRSHHPALWLVIWDPMQPVATRPLATQKGGTWYTYGIDLTKNVCEVFGSTGYIATGYTYSPFGEVTAMGNVEQPIQWSGEFNDAELGLIYYVNRVYNPLYGSWTSKDNLTVDGYNLYQFLKNSPCQHFDILGNSTGNPNHGLTMEWEKRPLNETEKSILKNKNTVLDNTLDQFKRIPHPRCWEHGCKTVTFIIELGDPLKGIIKKKIGHAAVAVGQNFYDFGPKEHGMYGDGGYYWANPEYKYWNGKWKAGHKVTLNNVKNNLNILAPNNAVVEFITCVCLDQADNMEKALKQLQYEDYELWWDQCASTTGDIYFDSIDNSKSFFLTSPEGLLDVLVNDATIACGPNKGGKPKARVLQHYNVQYKYIEK